MGEPPPPFLPLDLRRLKAGKQQLLLGVAEKVFQVETMRVRLIGREQVNFVSSPADNDEPEPSLVHRLAVVIELADANQGKRMAMHRQPPGFLFTPHEHIVPGVDAHLVVATPTAEMRGGDRLVGLMPGVGFLKREGLAMPARMTSPGKRSTRK